MIKSLVISAPFGNYISRPFATSTVGTYTLAYRAGFWKRCWRVVSTLRPRVGGWVNRLGLPNPGIRSLEGQHLRGKILSVHGFNRQEWLYLGYWVGQLQLEAVEANLSCPNVTSTSVGELVDGCLALLSWGVPVIAKLLPIRWMDFVKPLYVGGVRHFHLCNTLPTPGGGLSGKILMPLSLWAVSDVRQVYGDEVEIIGGGGVSCVGDALRYVEAGADRVAVGSALLNPFRGRAWLGRVSEVLLRG